MVKVALFVRLEAKPGKEKDVESFLKGGSSSRDGGACHCCMVWNSSWALHFWNL